MLLMKIKGSNRFKNGKEEIPHYIRNDRSPLRNKERHETSLSQAARFMSLSAKNEHLLP